MTAPGTSRSGQMCASRAITAIGRNLAAQVGETVRDEHGLALAPGFIDMHSHHDRGIFDDLDAEVDS